MSDAAGTLAGGSGLSENQRVESYNKEKKKELKLFGLILTNDGEVEGSLTETKAVPQLNSVAATVFLLSTADCQFAADVTALDGDIFCPFLDLYTVHRVHLSHTIHLII